MAANAGNEPSARPAPVFSAAARSFLVDHIEGINFAHLQADSKCPVCLDSYAAGGPQQPVRVRLCSHMFCAECIQTHVEGNQPNSSTCPLCRKNWFIPDVVVRDEDYQDQFPMPTMQEALTALQARIRGRAHDLDTIRGIFDYLRRHVDELNLRAHTGLQAPVAVARDRLYRAFDRFIDEFEEMADGMDEEEEQEFVEDFVDDNDFLVGGEQVTEDFHQPSFSDHQRPPNVASQPHSPGQRLNYRPQGQTHDERNSNTSRGHGQPDPSERQSTGLGVSRHNPQQQYDSKIGEEAQLFENTHEDTEMVDADWD